MTGARIKAASLIASAALLLAACTGGDAIVTETPTPTATASTEASPTASTQADATAEALSDEELLALLPEGATFDNVSGAAVTAMFFVDELGRAYSSGDTRVIRALGTDSCDYCEGQAIDIESAAAAGDTWTGGDISLDPTRTENNMPGDGYAYVGVHGAISELRVTDATGAESLLSEAGDIVWTMQLVFENGVWRVNGSGAERE